RMRTPSSGDVLSQPRPHGLGRMAAEHHARAPDSLTGRSGRRAHRGRARAPRVEPVSPLGAPVPRVSVVVPTRNRGELLARILAALERQTLPRGTFEVVVVDDASADDTPSVLAAAEARAAGPFRRLHRAESSGPAAA